MNKMTFSDLKKTAKNSKVDSEDFGYYYALDRYKMYLANNLFVSKWSLRSDGIYSHVCSVNLHNREKFSKRINNFIFTKVDDGSLPDDVTYIHDFYDLYAKVLNCIELSADIAGITPDQIELYRSLLGKSDYQQLLDAWYDDENTTECIKIYSEQMQLPENECILTMYFKKLEELRHSADCDLLCQID